MMKRLKEHSQHIYFLGVLLLKVFKQHFTEYFIWTNSFQNSVDSNGNTEEMVFVVAVGWPGLACNSFTAEET